MNISKVMDGGKGILKKHMQLPIVKLQLLSPWRKNGYLNLNQV